MKLKRVLLPFTGQELGGSHISAFTLGESLQADWGVEVTVLAVHDSLILHEAARRGFALVPLAEKPALRHNLLFEAARLPQRAACLRRFGAGTVLHANDAGALQSWGPAARLHRMATVYHRRAISRLNFANRFTLRFADHLVSISEVASESVRPLSWLPQTRVDNPFSIPVPADQAGVRAAFLAEFGAIDDGPLIGFVGNFWERKRPHFFLEAAAAVLKRRPETRFVLFGRDGEYSRADLESHAGGLGIAERVIFAGFRLPVENNLAILDLLAITALREPLGRTPIEAAMLGVPYVGVDDAGIGEVGRRFGGGLLVSRDATTGDYAEAIISTLAGSGARPLDGEGRERLRDELSARRHAERMIAIYERVLAGFKG